MVTACSDSEPEKTSEADFTFHIEPFSVPAGEEIQDCYFVEVPDQADGADLWVDKFRIELKPGSHHMNVFRIGTVGALDGKPGDVVKGGECWKGGNWADWPLIVNSQASSEEQPFVEWQLPAGVAQRFAPGEKLMLQTHYVNATTQETPGQGEVSVAFFRSKEKNPVEMGTLFAKQSKIRVCQSTPAASYHGTCRFASETPIHVAAANGHFHSRGLRFGISTWDGATAPTAAQEFYQSESWDDPPMAFGMDMSLPQGGGIWWSCDYQWEKPPTSCDAVNAADAQKQNDCCYTFGSKVETNEHCNAFIYYWPKLPAASVTCEI
jgi:hypothetical protein